jgi:hypothetical protein
MEKLGAGGMGVVYKAQMPGLDGLSLRSLQAQLRWLPG